ncbi:hypothetical protein BGZ74_004819, partial [Mortierella antarctica]
IYHCHWSGNYQDSSKNSKQLKQPVEDAMEDEGYVESNNSGNVRGNIEGSKETGPLKKKCNIIKKSCKHRGHELSDPRDFEHLHLTDALKARIRNLACIGLSTRRIHQQINLPHHDILIQQQKGLFQCEHGLRYDDVYNIFYKWFSKITILDKNDCLSMQMWIEKLQVKKQFTTFSKEFEVNGKDGKKYHKFAFGFMLPFQHSVFASNHYSIGLDSTHGTNCSKHELFTIVVQDPVQMTGVPVAFLLMNDHSHHSISEWLKHIKPTVGTPKFITTDDAKVEHKAIQKAFGHEVTIHLCLWHIIKAMAHGCAQHVTHIDNQPHKEVKEAVVKDLCAIVYEPDKQCAQQRCLDFEQKWGNHNDGELWAYLKSNYFHNDSCKQKWMKCFHVDLFYGAMDTNNYVESWHNHLKSHFLQGHTNC